MDACFEDLQSRSAATDLEVQLGYLAIHSLVRWFHTLETSPRRYVSEEQAASMMQSGTSFLKASERLVYFATEQNLLRWKVLPKHHEPRASRSAVFSVDCLLVFRLIP